eukprot:UN11188
MNRTNVTKCRVSFCISACHFDSHKRSQQISNLYRPMYSADLSCI